MRETIEDRAGDGLVVEHGAPVSRCSVGGQDDRPALIARGHHLEEKVGGVLVDGQVAELVDDEDVGPGEGAQLLVERGVALRRRQLVDDLHRGAEEHAVSSLAGGDAKGDREVALAETGRPDEQDVAPVLDELEVEEREGAITVDLAGVVPVEPLQGLEDGEPGPADPTLDAAVETDRGLVGQDRVKEREVAQALLRRLGEMVAVGLEGSRETQVLEVLRDPSVKRAG